jgi:hypothetical protein
MKKTKDKTQHGQISTNKSENLVELLVDSLWFISATEVAPMKNGRMIV